MIDLNSADNWSGVNALYTIYVDGALTTLNRANFREGFIATADPLIAACVSKGMTKGQRIVVVGAQFGWFAERLVELGYGPFQDGTANGKVGAVDTSAWIQANLTGNATVAITNQDVNGNTGRRAIKQLFGSQNAVIDWVIDYMILPCLIGAGDVPGGNNEIVPYCQSLRALATNVVHCLTPLYLGPPQQDARMNWKTMAAWKAWVTPDFVVEEGTSNIL